MMICPYCAEEIQQGLDVCPFCRSNLVEPEDWQPAHEDIGANAAMRMLLPVGVPAGQLPRDTPDCSA